VIDELMKVEHRWVDTNRVNLKESERNLSQCHFILNESHLDCLYV